MADRAIYPYDVEIVVKRTSTGLESTVTRTEHAYAVVDAVMQASINISGEDPGLEVVRVLHVSPPIKAILRSRDEAVLAALTFGQAPTVPPR